MRNLHDIEGRTMPEKKDDLTPTAGPLVALLLALGMICGTVVAIVYIIWG